MKIAISGKGGSGKTTISATLARTFARRGAAVLAIDGDPNPNLGVALGLSAEQLARLQPVPRDIAKREPTEDGKFRLVITKSVEEIKGSCAVTGPDGVRVLMGSRADNPGGG
jgi:CO dehydrogenase maturation factor